MKLKYIRNIVLTFVFCLFYFTVAVILNKTFETGTIFKFGIIECILMPIGLVNILYNLLKYSIHKNYEE